MADFGDQGSAIEELNREHALAAIRRSEAPMEHRRECKECENPLPMQRQAHGFPLCVGCQEFVERRR